MLKHTLLLLPVKIFGKTRLKLVPMIYIICCQWQVEINIKYTQWLAEHENSRERGAADEKENKGSYHHSPFVEKNHRSTETKAGTFPLFSAISCHITWPWAVMWPTEPPQKADEAHAKWVKAPWWIQKQTFVSRIFQIIKYIVLEVNLWWA